jgi:hypothetical protein
MAATWPPLAFDAWRDTAMTLQLWTQVIGKIRLASTPWLNHSWQVPLYVTARGLATSPMPSGAEVAEIEFDFIQHRLIGRSSNGAVSEMALTPMTVADFYHSALSLACDIGLTAAINPVPAELPDPIPFPDDRSHRAYDGEAAHRFWRVLLQADRLFKLFRTGFLGKTSPVHFFWGSFDLAVTRFSGRTAPLHPGGIAGVPDAVTREAYSHEVSSAGFWPGNEQHPDAAFFSYAYPTPQGFAEAQVEPAAAFWSPALGEWLLPYEAVRTAADPDHALLRFLQTTYRAAADLGDWDRGLECAIGVPRRPRPLQSPRSR